MAFIQHRADGDRTGIDEPPPPGLDGGGEPGVDWSDLVDEEARLQHIREFLARDERRRRRRRLIGIGAAVCAVLLLGATLMARLISNQAPPLVAKSEQPPPAGDRQEPVAAQPVIPNPQGSTLRESPAPAPAIAPTPAPPREATAPARESVARAELQPADRPPLAGREPAATGRETPARPEAPAPRAEPPSTGKSSAAAPPATKPATPGTPAAKAPAPTLAPAVKSPIPAPSKALATAKPVPPASSSTTSSAAPVRSAELPPRVSVPVQSPVLAPPMPSRTPTPVLASVSYHPRDRLSAIRAGDSKDKVFGILATSFERQNGSLVRIEGIRLRASARSPRDAHVEVAEARIGETSGAVPYWFLFSDERLVAWGRPDEWSAAVARYQIQTSYTPDASRNDPTRLIR